MIPINLSEIASFLKIKYIGIDKIIKTISINSNIILEQCMFIALIGKKFDGHDFAEQAVASGAQALLVNRYLLLRVAQLVVADTNDALIKIAKLVCNRASSKIVFITGSSGKTSVKEMTTSILKESGEVTATQKNFNNLIGVPMTLLNLTKRTNFAVIELGSNKIGELRQLSTIFSSDVALVNNIFPSHLLEFKSLCVIKKEKGEIFRSLIDQGQAVINDDNHAFFLWSSILKGKKIWRFSLYNKFNVDFFSSNVVVYNHGMKFILHTPCGKGEVFLSMLGYHNVSNALAASALAFSVGANLSEIIVGLQNMQALPGRLFPIVLNKGRLLLLDDSYNSNVGSMMTTISVLNSMPGYKVLVISDMLELGVCNAIKYHRYIGRYINTTNVHYVLTLGTVSYFVNNICKRGKHFKNKSELIVYLNKILLQYQYISIAVKGSRKFQMEDIVNFIKDKSKCCYGC